MAPDGGMNAFVEWIVVPPPWVAARRAALEGRRPGRISFEARLRRAPQDHGQHY
jgi:hypothetical protein